MLNIKGRDLLPSAIMEKYQVTDDQGKATFTISDISEPIDAVSVMVKYNRRKRKITESEFLNLHVYAVMVRLAKSLLNRLNGNQVLVDQRNRKPWPLFGEYFWSDNGAFLWSIEFAGQFCFRVHCQISAVL